MKVHSVLAVEVDQTVQGYLKESICVQEREIFGLHRNILKVIRGRLFSQHPHLFQKD